MHTLAAALAIILLAGFTQSTTGFGFALVATSLLLFLLEPKSVVAINIILGSINSILILFRWRKHVDLRRVALIFAGSIFGIPLGAYLLTSLDPSTIKLVIAILIIPLAISLLLGRSYRFKHDTLGHVVAGFISGALVASTSIGGPPVILFLLSQDLDKERFIGTLNAYFISLGLVTIGTYSFLGMITVDILKQVGIFLPALVLGFYAGTKATHRISAALFRKLAVSLILVSALAIIVTTLT